MSSPLCARADNEWKGSHVELQAAATPGPGTHVWNGAEFSEMNVGMHNVLTEL
jgi:hypothetical protein